MSKVIWTDYAKLSLQDNLDFLEEQWGNNLKEEVIDLIDKRMNQVLENPNLAPTIKGTNYKRLLIHKHLSLFYILEPETIKVLLVWDNRQNPNKLLQSLMI